MVGEAGALLTDKDMSGRRLSVWIPEDDCWIFDVLDTVQREFEERGFPISYGELGREYLIPVMQPYKVRSKPSEMISDTTPAETSKCLKRSIAFRKQDVWFLDALVKIVDTKQSAGFKTSVSYELIRLAKNALTGAVDGSAFDRKVLKL